MNNQSLFIVASTITLVILSTVWHAKNTVNLLIKCWMIGLAAIGIILSDKIYHLM